MGTYINIIDSGATYLFPCQTFNSAKGMHSFINCQSKSYLVQKYNRLISLSGGIGNELVLASGDNSVNGTYHCHTTVNACHC